MSPEEQEALVPIVREEVREIIRAADLKRFKNERFNPRTD